MNPRCVKCVEMMSAAREWKHECFFYANRVSGITTFEFSSSKSVAQTEQRNMATQVLVGMTGKRDGIVDERTGIRRERQFLRCLMISKSLLICTFTNIKE
jgi:hypothetical protein